MAWNALKKGGTEYWPKKGGKTAMIRTSWQWIIRLPLRSSLANCPITDRRSSQKCNRKILSGWYWRHWRAKRRGGVECVAPGTGFRICGDACSRAMTEDYDINFVSRDFYRGTTRGFEFSLVDILSISLVLSGLLVPRGTIARVLAGKFRLHVNILPVRVLQRGHSRSKVIWLFELSKMVRGMVIFLAVAFFVRGERELRLFCSAWD